MGGGAWNAKTSPGAKELVDKFVAKFGEEPDYWGGLYYWSSLQHFKQAIEKAGTLDQKKIRDIMAKEKFDTALGPFWYDEDRYFVNHPGEIGQWQKGVFEVIDPGPQTHRGTRVSQAGLAGKGEITRIGEAKTGKRVVSKCAN